MKILRIVLLLLFCVGAAAAQAQDPLRRPRIGLALAGGSARAMAHVGVLRWLEQHRIPVDYVAGTSMGGLVGGLYATGATADEIEAFLAGVDWDQVFAGSISYREAAFRRKEDLREFPSSLEFGLRGGFELATALNPGHAVELALSRYAAPYADLRSFDDLPTPFRCVAADLVEGKEVVLDAGDLEEALRATMSLPVIFAPLRKGKQVLVDGGVLNNLPVDVVKQMGAEIVIAVALPMAEDPAPAASLVGVASRSLAIMIEGNERRNLQLADLVLMPDLKGLTPADFDRHAEFARRGYAEAARKERFLATLAVAADEWQAYLEARRSRRRPAAFTPQFVEVEGATGRRKAQLEKRLSRLAGAPLDVPRLERELTRVTGLGRYEAAGYAARRRDGRDGLRVAVREKSYGPPTLKLLFDAEGFDLDDVRFGVGARLTWADLGGPFSEWRADLSLGNPNHASTEYVWRPGGGPFFLAPRSFVEYARRGFYRGSARIAELAHEEFGAGLDFGLAAGRSHEFRVGYALKRTAEFVATGVSGPPRVEGVFHGARAAWTYDGLDAPIVPRRGLRVTTRAEWVLDGPQVARAFPVVESEVLAGVPWTSRYSLLVRLAGGTTANRAAPIPPFHLGGPLRLSALATQQLSGENYYLGSFTLLRSFSVRPVRFLSRTYLSLSYEVGDAFDAQRPSNPFHDGALGLLSETPLGVFFFGGSVGESGERKMFFRIGRLF